MKVSLHLLLVVFLLTVTSACHVGRFFVRNYANITDERVFPYDEIATGSPKSVLPQAASAYGLDTLKLRTDKWEHNLSGYLDRRTSTVGFVVLQQDSIVFEEYYDGYGASSTSMIFSVSKSITSLSCGIAVDDGYIESVDDPVVKYLPEFADGHPYWKELTIRQCLDMRSGLDYKESYSNPFSDMAKLYYGTNSTAQLKKLDFVAKPGTLHDYQSGTTSIIGLVVERATGQPLAEYLSEKVWIPMGMEYPATFSLDDKEHRIAKAYCGINATARDLAKIGMLYSNQGRFNGKQIVSEQWVEASITPDAENDLYQYQWYSPTVLLRDDTGAPRIFEDSLAALMAIETESLSNSKVYPSKGKYVVKYTSGAFYAQGILNQFIYVDPESDIVIVRQGKKWDDGYLWLFDSIVAKVKATKLKR